jgi:uncharacterized membrane protein
MSAQFIKHVVFKTRSKRRAKQREGGAFIVVCTQKQLAPLSSVILPNAAF